MIKKAMILAAGFGKRIQPLTLKSPKPLLKIGNETLLSNTLKFYNHNFSSRLSLGNNDNDDMDAIVSCAALKYFVDKQAGFSYPFASKEILKASRLEGWILGVN